MSTSKPDGPPRVALVTGASRGIGRAAAVALALSGAHVVALARTQGGLEELDDEIRALRPAEPGATTLVPMDLRDFAAIDRLGEALYRRWGRLDALCRQCGRARPPVPSPPPRPQDMGRRHRGQRHRQLAPHPLARPAAAPLRGGAGRVHDLRRGEPGGAARLLGPLCSFEGGARRPRPHLRRRDRQHFDHSRHAYQPGTAANADARQGHARRRSRRRCARRRSSRPRSSRSARPIGPRPANCTIFPRIGFSASNLPPERATAAQIDLADFKRASILRPRRLRPAGG